ncbi:MAG TPA: hypothetical protein VGG41_14380 [Solirubrobacteraceae bacterium]|jgi:hypothetical protein
MTPDPVQMLQKLNPALTSTAPPIDRLWARLDAEAGMPHPADIQIAPHASGASLAAPPTRRLWSGSHVLSALTVGIVLVIVAAAVLLVHPKTEHPSVAAGGHEPGLVQILGVLRRPQTAADRKAERKNASFFRAAGRSSGRAGASRTMTPITSRARVAARLPGGQPLVLMPVKVHPPHTSGQQPYVGLALLGGGGSCCNSVAEIEAGDAFTSSGGVGGNQLVVVVPDGVARVRVKLPHPITVTAHNNVAIMRPRTGVENIQQYAMTWYARDGAVIKHFAAGRTTKPTAAESKAFRREVLTVAEHTNVKISPSIRSAYPLFSPGFHTLTVGSGPTSFVVTHPGLAQLPTDALGDAGTVPKYRTAPRDAREVQIRDGLNLWLEPGHRICIYGPTPTDNVCTPITDPSAALIAKPSGPGDPNIIIALLPRTNSTAEIITSDSSWSTPTHDGLVVVAATNVTALRYRTNNGQTTTHAIRLH